MEIETVMSNGDSNGGGDDGGGVGYNDYRLLEEG